MKHFDMECFIYLLRVGCGFVVGVCVDKRAVRWLHVILHLLTFVYACDMRMQKALALARIFGFGREDREGVKHT